MEPPAPPSRPTGAAGGSAGAKPARRGRKWFVAGVVVLALAVVLGIPGRGRKSEDVTMSFAGFTNVDGKARAFLWVTNRSRHSVNLFQVATQREGGRWVNESEGGGRIHQTVVESRAGVREAPAGQSQNPMEGTVLMSFEVGEAGQPFRTVVHAREPPTGANKLKGKLVQWYWKLRGGGLTSSDRSRYYSVTNEFWPER